MKPILIQKSPIQFLPNVSDHLRCHVYVKREDLCHVAHGGNKARKLAYILEDVVEKQVTDLIVVGVRGSNHIWATAFHAASLGLAVHAVVLPHPHNQRSQAVERDTLRLGARLVSAQNDFDVLLKVARLRRELILQNRRPQFIPPGGSSPLSSQGYVDAAQEILEQSSKSLDASFCAIGSGGTLAGILAGTVIYDLPWRVFGVSVRNGWAHSKFWIWHQARRTLQLKNSDLKIPFSKIEILKSEIGAGYGVPTIQGHAAANLFAKDGIHLDATYTAKAAAGMMAQAQANPRWKAILFWLTHVPAPS